MTEQSTIKNPYVGPRTFSEAEADRFFGREREARDLRSMVLAERLVLFYAQSGAGKSSLINTRLIPQLRDEEGFEVLPVGRVSGDLPEGLAAHEVNNIYSFNLNLSLSQSDTALPPEELRRLAGLTLADFLGGGEETPDGDPDADEDEEYVYEDVPYLLVIDQFEEIVTTHPGRWPERAAFFEQLRQALERHPNLWLVLVMREDFVAAFDPYLQWLPNRLRARYYMQRMGVEAARQAIREPAAAAGREFTPEAARQLVDNLRRIRRGAATPSANGDAPPTGADAFTLGQYVEPVQLQVVCYQLWENLGEQPSPQPSGEETASRPGGRGSQSTSPPLATEGRTEGGPTNQITPADLGDHGDVDTALADFYEEVLDKTLAATGLPEVELRPWFDEELITEAGTRGTVYQGEESTAGLPNAAVDHLAGQFLLRAEPRAGGIWVELVHDRFVEPIRRANQRWETERLQRNPLMRPTQVWQAAGHSAEQLLGGAQLREAQSYAANHPEDVTDKERTFLQDSLTHEAEERRRRRNQYVLGGIIMAVLAGLMFWGWNRAVEATEQAEAAAVAERKALEQASAASTAEAQAEIQARLAEQRAAEAASAQETAVANEQEAARQAFIAATRAAEAEQSQDEAEEARQIAVAAQQEAEESLATATAALATAIAAQEAELAAQAETEVQQRLNISLELANEARYQLNKDPELSLWLARQAVLKTYRIDQSAPTEAINVLHEVLAGSRLERTLAHTDTVESVAFDPNGARLATALESGSINIWNMSTGERLLSFRGHEKTLFTIVFSPDDDRLATASQDGTAKIWRADTGQELTTLAGHTDMVIGVAFSPDGGRLATASSDKTARIWNVLNGDQLQILDTHQDQVSDIVFSPDGTRLATGSEDNTAKIWEAESGQELLTLSGHSRGVRSVAFSPNGTRLATASWDRTAGVWDMTTGDQLHSFSSDPDFNQAQPVRDVAFSPTGESLAIAYWDGKINVWDISTEKLRLFLPGHTGRIFSLTFNPKGTHLATAGEDNAAKIWDVRPNANREPETLPALQGHTERVYTVVFSPDDTQLATASQDATTKLWNAASGQVIQTLVPTSPCLNLDENPGKVFDVAFSLDGQRLATGHGDGKARIWDAESGQLLTCLHTGHVIYGIALSPDNTYLATALSSGQIKVWVIETGQELFPELIHHPTKQLNAVAFSPDGNYLASTGIDGTTKIWNATTGQYVRNLGEQVDFEVLGNDVAFSPDRRHLATSGTEKVAIWNIESRLAPLILSGHRGEVFDVVFDSNGTRLATASADNTAKIWDAESGKLLLSLSTPAVARSVAFSHDGTRLAVARDDGLIRQYILDIDTLLQLAGGRITRQITSAECLTYLKADECSASP